MLRMNPSVFSADWEPDL